MCSVSQLYPWRQWLAIVCRGEAERRRRRRRRRRQTHHEISLPSSFHLFIVAGWPSGWMADWMAQVGYHLCCGYGKMATARERVRAESSRVDESSRVQLHTESLFLWRFFVVVEKKRDFVIVLERFLRACV